MFHHSILPWTSAWSFLLFFRGDYPSELLLLLLRRYVRWEYVGGSTSWGIWGSGGWGVDVGQRQLWRRQTLQFHRQYMEWKTSSTAEPPYRSPLTRTKWTAILNSHFVWGETLPHARNLRTYTSYVYILVHTIRTTTFENPSKHTG